MRFQIRSALTLLGRRWYFRGRARNGEIILQSEGYRNHADCLAAVEYIRAKAASAPVDDTEFERSNR